MTAFASWRESQKAWTTSSNNNANNIQFTHFVKRGYPIELMERAAIQTRRANRHSPSPSHYHTAKNGHPCWSQLSTPMMIVWTTLSAATGTCWARVTSLFQFTTKNAHTLQMTQLHYRQIVAFKKKESLVIKTHFPFSVPTTNRPLQQPSQPNKPWTPTFWPLTLCFSLSHCHQ